MKSRRALVRLAWQIIVGGFAAFLATACGALAGMLVAGADAAEIAQNVGLVAEAAVDNDKPYVTILVAPILETFLFLIVFNVLKAMKLTRERRLAVPALAFTMGIIGWLIHGADRFTVAQASGYAVLGGLFAFLSLRSGRRRAFVGTALAHMIWNASVSSLALVYSPRTVWEGRVSHAVLGRTQIDVVGRFETSEQCRLAAFLHLQRLGARYKAQQQEVAATSFRCERRIRSGWHSD